VQLPAPTTAAGAGGLRALVEAPASALVALDFDGTLSPIVEDPEQARPAPGAVDAIRGLANVVDTVAVVTGRPAGTAARLLGFDQAVRPQEGLQNLLILGHYGLERWTAEAGVVRDAAIDTGAVDAARTALPALLERFAAPAGTTIEDKAESVAVHVRRTADPAAAFELLREPLARLAESHGLRLEPGRMVLELRPLGIDKGLALESLAGERQVAVVCYAGDDLGDLAAFEALDRLRSKGIRALKICSGSAEVPELQARADLVVDGPEALVALLSQLVDAAKASR
jgi:trehalose 6-phosphate phosphatase